MIRVTIVAIVQMNLPTIFTIPEVLDIIRNRVFRN